MWRTAMRGFWSWKSLLHFKNFPLMKELGHNGVQKWAVNNSLILRTIKSYWWVMVIFLSSASSPWLLLGNHWVYSSCVHEGQSSHVFIGLIQLRDFYWQKLVISVLGVIFCIPLSHGAWQDWHKYQSHIYNFGWRWTLFFSFPSPLGTKKILVYLLFSYL